VLLKSLKETIIVKIVKEEKLEKDVKKKREIP